MISKRLQQNCQRLMYHTKQQTFDNHLHIHNQFLSEPNSITNWSHHIRNCISQRDHIEALLIYNRIRRSQIYHLGIVPLIAKACASLSSVEYGKALHAESLKIGILWDVVVGTSLIDMYAKCGCIIDSRTLFDEMRERNVVTWNAMIGGYMINGDTGSALLLFERMPTRSAITWIEMIVGFANARDIAKARFFFERVPLELKTVVTWAVMVDAYVSNGEMEAAKDIFVKMPMRNCFAWSSMICGYCKKGDVKEAKAMFDKFPERNLVNWNSLISGYTQNGYCEEALDLFKQMQNEGFEPDEVTLASVLSACGQLSLLDAGKEIHQKIIQKGIKINQFIQNGLVDVYSKCGDLGNAREIFKRMTMKNNSCWNSMILGLAIHGKSEEALEFFRLMESSSEKPNEITFLSVLSACAHGGLVKEGLKIFSKIKEYGLIPSFKHYGCMTDLLGRAGKIKEAYDLIKTMPMKPNDTIWGALLGACRIHSDTNMMEFVLKEIINGDCKSGYCDDSHYVLLSNIYAASDSWEKTERMRTAMIDKGIKKVPGHSSIM